VTATTADVEGVSGGQPDALLRLSHVTAGYPTGGTALHDVSFDAPAHHVVGLLGANGAGKTTTLRAISGVLQHSGSVMLGDIELAGPPHQRAVAGVAHVPEGRRIYAGLNVRENLMLGAAGRPRGDRSDITSDLDRVVDLFPELVKHMGRSGAWLSGGEQQMVAIGRALMARPKVMLLDEPTMGLAPIVVERLADVFTSGAWRDLTLVVAEENVQFASTVSDTCVILRAGRVVWIGSAADLRASEEIQSMLLR
jgi:branched-chain amino acid transport system ATP-binding protein